MASNRVECRLHPTCKRSFKSHNAMKQHFLASHSQGAEKRHEKSYACERCNRFFRKQEGLQDHMRSRHFTPHDTQAASNIYNKAPPVLLPSDQLHLLHTMACNDDALHVQHQWASAANHTLVSKSPNPNHGTRGLFASSQCNNMELNPTAQDLDEKLFVDQHPSEVLKSSEEHTWQQEEECFSSALIKPAIKLYKVHHIFKLYNPVWSRKNFEQFRNKKIKAQMSNQTLIEEDNLELHINMIHDDNKLLWYHGNTMKGSPLARPTKIKDNDTEALSLCKDTDCSLCHILKTVFKKSKYRVKSFLQFCKGVYYFAISSKAPLYDECNESAQKASSFNWFYSCFGRRVESTNGKGNCKVLMDCRVILGHPHHSTRNFQNLKGFLNGSHFVQGKMLKNDELDVYDDHAYIILYTSGGD